MTLLKDAKKPKGNLQIVDGWNFGIGFGLAMAIALPIILLLLSCLVGIGLSIVGTSLSAFLGG